jgi:hypothetical protein
METISRKVDDLSASDRTALEQLLGHELEHGQQVTVMAYHARENDESARAAARTRILATLDKAARNAAEQGITTEEMDAAVDEAMEVIRHRSAR